MNETVIIDGFFSQFSQEKKLQLFDLFSKHPELFLWLQQNLFGKKAARDTHDIQGLKKVLASEKQDIEKKLQTLAEVLNEKEIASLRSKILL